MGVNYYNRLLPRKYKNVRGSKTPFMEVNSVYFHESSPVGHFTSMEVNEERQILWSTLYVPWKKSAGNINIPTFDEASHLITVSKRYVSPKNDFEEIQKYNLQR